MNDCVVLRHGNRRRRKKTSPNNSTTEIWIDSSSSAFRPRHFSEKQVEPTSPFTTKKANPLKDVDELSFVLKRLRQDGSDFGGGEGPCRGGKVEDEPTEGAGASSVPPEGGGGKESSGGAQGAGAPEGDGGGGGAAEANGGGRKSVEGDGGGGGKRPPRHSGGKKRSSAKAKLSATEDEEDEFLPGKTDKWWLRRREFDFIHYGTKMKRPKYRGSRTPKSRIRVKSVVADAGGFSRLPQSPEPPKVLKRRAKNSAEADDGGFPSLPPQSPEPQQVVKRRAKSRSKGKNSADAETHDLGPQQQTTSQPKNAGLKRWAAAVNKVNAVSRFRVSGDTESKRKVVSAGEEVSKMLEEEKRVKEQWEFSDSEISSNEEEENLSAANDFEGQLDSEWLHREENRSRTKKKLDEISAGKKLPTEPDFLSVMLPLYRVMTLCGCFPFKIVRSSDGSAPQFQFVRKSKEYAACVVSFFVFGLSSTYMTYNLLISIYLEQPPYTIYNQVLAIEFDKFWSDAVIMLLWFYFIAISNAGMLIRGNNVAEFLTRWLEALTLIRYNATRGLRRFLFIIFLNVILLDAYNVVDFFLGWGHIRGSRGFIGLLIVDKFQNRVRLTLWPYKVAEYLGLFFDLYYSFCGISILALISAHAWTIDNAARRFNLRLGFSLGILKSEDVPFELRKMVRWKKLFVEHLVVTSFAKMLGKTFLVTLNAFFLFLVSATVISLFGLFSEVLLATPETDKDKEFFNVSGIAKLHEGNFVPVKNRLSLIVAFSKEIYAVGIIWTVAFVSLELLNRPGSTIMGGARFVFRKGYVDCKSLFERRFVSSMMFSYATRARSAVRPGFPVDRVFISKFLSFAFGVFMIFIEFHPQQLQRHTALICDVFGGCQLITISKVAHTKPAYPWHLQPIENGARTTTARPKLVPIGNIPEVLVTPPCNSGGRRPKGWPEFATQRQCDGRKGSPVYKLSLFQLTNGRFSRFPVDCGENSVAPPTGDFYDCFGEIVDLNVTDECGNHFIPTPDLLGDSQNPGMQVSVLEVGGSKAPQVFCCFVYDQLETQAEVCNLPEGSRGRCRKTQTGFEAMEASFVELWRSSGGSVDLSVRKRWALCLCQGIGGVAPSDVACNDLEKSLTTSAAITTTTKSTTTTTTPIPRSCSAIEVRQKMCDCENEGDNRDLFNNSPLHSECPGVDALTVGHLRLGLVEVEDRSAARIVYANGEELVNSCVAANRKAPYPRYPPADSKSTLYDCFGEVVSPVSFKDDCGNPRIAFPNSKGERTLPQLRAKEEMRQIDVPDIRFRRIYFVCCWDYRSIHTDVEHEGERGPEICSNLRWYASGPCAIRLKIIDYEPAADIGDDNIFRQECGEQIFTTVGSDENVNSRFLENCEARAPNPCKIIH